MSYHKAVQAYQKKTDENLSPLQIVVELYKGMIKNTKDAKRHWQNGHLDLMTDSITKVFNIIEALQAHLDMEQGGEDAVFLNRFYNVIFSALSRATSKPEPGEEFDSIVAYIQQVTDKWYAIAYDRPADNTAPEMSSAQSVGAV
ncbi:MAG: flagellar export chaperone FliS [Micavibrio aeruginosavorus]|uniref:Flagellar export chaperone FliS n=1 Tax=Micavibrio aeruginosavorus TaxID=349221 RepID=A0A2W5FL56_9BACT|nr:MAG: flagellar export chaperone FliS [Micavibrio aeruginosavorus]